MSRYISIYYASRSQRLRTTSQPRDRQRFIAVVVYLRRQGPSAARVTHRGGAGKAERRRLRALDLKHLEIVIARARDEQVSHAVKRDPRFVACGADDERGTASGRNLHHAAARA